MELKNLSKEPSSNCMLLVRNNSTIVFLFYSPFTTSFLLLVKEYEETPKKWQHYSFKDPEIWVTFEGREF